MTERALTVVISTIDLLVEKAATGDGNERCVTLLHTGTRHGEDDQYDRKLSCMSFVTDQAWLVF